MDMVAQRAAAEAAADASIKAERYVYPSAYGNRYGERQMDQQQPQQPQQPQQQQQQQQQQPQPQQQQMQVQRNMPMNMYGSRPSLRSAIYLPETTPVQNKNVIDREKVCPLLIRVFTKMGIHHNIKDFAKPDSFPQGEVQIYTWKDATLRELTDLIQEVEPLARRPQTYLSFSFVYPDRKGRNIMKEVGITHSTNPGEDDTKTLAELNFETGDFLDVAFFTRSQGHYQ